ncbi:MAG: tetratricopeptide repeat protein [Candidatus Omnitrophota bacterium]|nr:tetratricopeptide repeat protein [Candidatus Omnitrophota bacterium]MDZ4243064.1 tetratricopeptide repeat protein [Candidatus Omnitrophota bacterium]
MLSSRPALLLEKIANPRTALVLLAGLGAAAYVNAIPHPFVHDDVVFIQNNPLIRDWDLARIFAPAAARPAGELINPYYRPVLDILYRLLYAVSGGNPHGFHAFNAALHIFNGGLLYLLMSRILRRPAFAFGVAALFLLHPVQTEPVACIAGVSNLFFAGLFLGIFHLYLNVQEQEGGRRFLTVTAAAVLFAVALLSKEQAAVLPVLLLWYEAAYRGGGNRKPAAGGRVTIWVLAGILLSYFLFRKIFLGQWLVPLLDHREELFLRLLAVPRMILTDLQLLSWPAGLHYYRSIDVLSPSAGGWLGLGAVLVMMSAAVRRSRGTARQDLVFGLGWFFITLAPTLNVLPLIHEYSFVAAFEHFLYLPAAGFAVVALGVGRDMFNRIFKSRAADAGVICFGVILLACAGLTIRQNTFWRGEVPLFERAVRYEPGIGRLRALLGRAYYFEGRQEQAAEEFHRAAEIFNGYAARAGDPRARSFYLSLLKGVHSDWAHSHEARGDLKAAVAQYEKALVIDPADAVVENNLGTVYARMGWVNLARQHFEKAVELDPRDPKALTNLAVCLILQGHPDRAEVFLRKALEIDPQFAPARSNWESLRGQKRAPGKT